MLASNDDIQDGVLRNSRLYFTASRSGTHVLEARGFDDAYSGSYTISAIAIPDDIGADPSRAASLAIGASATGTLNWAGDSDWFAVRLEAGRSYRFGMEGTGAVGTGLEDPHLFLLDGSGEVLTSNDDIKAGVLRHSRFTYTARSSGIHYLAARSFEDTYTGSYRVSSESLVDDLADSAITTASVSLGGVATGTLDFAGDSDWFQVVLEGDRTYQFWMEGTGLEDPYLYLRDGSGRFLASNDDIQNGVLRNARFSVAIAGGGTYYLEARSFEDAYTGAYRLGVSAVDDDAGQSLSGARALAVGSSLSGSIEWLGDSDWFRTTLEAGNLYDFSLSGTGLADPYLYLRGDDGRLLSQNDDIQLGVVRNANLSFRAETSGTYLLEARAWENRYTGGYSLNSRLVETGPAPVLASMSLASTFPVASGFSSGDGFGLASAERAAEYLVGINLPNRPALGGSLWSNDLLGAPEVWAGRGRFRGSRGQGVTIEVVDSGVDLDHPEFSGRLLEGFDFVDMDRTPEDDFGHGTHVAGILAGADDGAGVWGIAPEAWILPVRVLDNNGSGNNANVAAGIRWAADQGVDVINLSLGGGFNQEVYDAIRYAHGKGAVLVMAAGNDGAAQPAYPGRFASSYGIAVGAVNSAGTMASWSNRAGSTPLTYVSAPGVEINSAFKDNSYKVWSGTSMAAPQVAGLAALLLGIDPTLTNTAVERLISASASHGGLAARTLADNRDPITGLVIL